ncbi:class II aldolase/adducin family protein [Streptomyces alboflavus]|uniref:class II aldolase/adducin family protein n=1 Tax=Streptomyces alboflavus TaxID=67267 RepID=UPI0030B87EB2
MTTTQPRPTAPGASPRETHQTQHPHTADRPHPSRTPAPSLSHPSARAAVVATAHALAARGLVHGRTGNVSLRTADGRVLITPTGVDLRAVAPDDLSVIDADGGHIDGPPPSKEAFLHAAVLRARPDARAVVHTHSQYAVAVSCLEGLDADDALPPLTAYYAMRVGRLPLLPYFAPGDERLAGPAEETARTHAALLLRHHGPVVAAPGLDAALEAVEELEQTARIFLLLRGTDHARLTEEQRTALAPRLPRPVALFSALAIKKALDDTVLEAFAGTTGIDVEGVYEPTNVLLDQIAGGARPDVMVGVTGGLERLAASGVLDQASLRPLARVGIGVAVPPGAPAVDVSSTQALVRALTSARSVAYSRTGASGVAFAALLDRLGIAAEVNSRATVVDKGFTALAVTDGRADLAVQQLSELRFVPDARVVGPLPEEVQHYTDLSIALGAHARQRPEAAALLRHLTAAPARAAYRAAGLEDAS